MKLEQRLILFHILDVLSTNSTLSEISVFLYIYAKISKLNIAIVNYN